MEASNLLVEARLVGSLPSVQYREDRPLLTPGLLLGGGEVGLPVRLLHRGGLRVAAGHQAGRNGGKCEEKEAA
jgi:hypothetical protein